MSTICSAPPRAQHVAGHAPGYSWASRSAATLKRWWAAYRTWQIERTAIGELQSMSDLELKDIGLSRSTITGAVRDEKPSQRRFTPYY